MSEKTIEELALDAALEAFIDAMEPPPGSCRCWSGAGSELCIHEIRAKLPAAFAVMSQPLRAEIDWYREKVLHTADALDGLSRRAKDGCEFEIALAFENAAKLVRRINDQSLLDAEDES